MPRRPNLDRPVRLELKLPATIRRQLDLLLYVPSEGRVPQGAYQQFFIDRIKEYLAKVKERK